MQDQYFNYIRMPLCARIAGTNGLSGVTLTGLPLVCSRSAPGRCQYVTSTAVCAGNPPEPIVVGSTTIQPTCGSYMLSIDGVPALCDTAPLYVEVSVTKLLCCMTSETSTSAHILFNFTTPFSDTI